MTARLLDTIPDFEKFARKAGLESPVIREQLWRELYHDRHPEVFEAFFAEQTGRQAIHALVRELSKVRVRVKEAAPVMPDLINEVEPAVLDVLGISSASAPSDASPEKDEAPAEDGAPKLPGEQPQTSPLHILMVGNFSTNGFAGRLGDEVAVYHCLEWFSGADPTKILIAHEDTHAWHRMRLPDEMPTDPAWMALYEGLAIHVSRAVVPGGPEYDYFWYGVAGFEDWLEECRKDERKLLEKFEDSLDEQDSVEAFFGGGFVEKKWRTGYYLADLLVGRIGKPIRELVGMSVEEGRKAIREVL